MRATILAAATLTLLAACSGGGGLHSSSSNTGGPDEFGVLPTLPLEMPQSVAVLPAPTPGGSNLTDPDPAGDAVAALGGRRSAMSAGGIPAADGVAAASRYGTDPAIRVTLAAEDATFRRNRARLGVLNLFNRDRYFSAYARYSLDAYAELARFRNLGVQVPSAPPAN